MTAEKELIRRAASTCPQSPSAVQLARLPGFWFVLFFQVGQIHDASSFSSTYSREQAHATFQANTPEFLKKNR